MKTTKTHKKPYIKDQEKYKMKQNKRKKTNHHYPKFPKNKESQCRIHQSLIHMGNRADISDLHEWKDLQMFSFLI